jgi:hypothetical protein
MKILFLHGWHSTPGGIKPTYLKDLGHEVLNPALPDNDFDAAVRIAQAEFDQHKPDVVVGSSRGGAVAMNINSGTTPLVLLCPAWKRWGTARTVKPGTAILHSKADETIPFADSQELLRNSGLPESALIVVGHEHRLADPESLAKMLEACKGLERKQRTIERTDDNGRTKRAVEHPPGKETCPRNRLAQNRGRNEGQGLDRARLEAEVRQAAEEGRAVQLHHRHRGEMVQE